jgi:hypothetical protein
MISVSTVILHVETYLFRQFNIGSSDLRMTVRKIEEGETEIKERSCASYLGGGNCNKP